MESGYVNVDTDRLRGNISDMLNELEAIKQDMRDLYENVEVLDGMWDGPANDEFNDQFTADYSLVTSNLEDIRKYLDNLDECRLLYNECENNVAQLVDTLQV